MWPGPVFCLLLGVSSDYAQPITGQVTEVTCPVIGRAQPELTPSKRQKTGPVQLSCKAWHDWFSMRQSHQPMESPHWWPVMLMISYNMGPVTQWPLLGLPSSYLVTLSSLCNSFEDEAPVDETPVDEIYGCPIFKWVAETWLKDRAPGW